ncbi:hypothetical protein ACSBR2_031085 [Camellia fascicularis]
MKILKANAGTLTNFDVFDFLRSRGAAKDSTRIIVSVAQSEFKVAYLQKIFFFVNIRPSSVVEIDPVILIECCYKFLSASLNMVKKL